MATRDEVQKLTALARIRIGDAELEKFTSEFDAILAYVGQLAKTAEGGSPDAMNAASREKPPLHNVMRADGEPHAAGAYTEKLVEQFPAREGNALSVKQIISHE